MPHTNNPIPATWFSATLVRLLGRLLTQLSTQFLRRNPKVYLRTRPLLPGRRYTEIVSESPITHPPAHEIEFWNYSGRTRISFRTPGAAGTHQPTRVSGSISWSVGVSEPEAPVSLFLGLIQLEPPDHSCPFFIPQQFNYIILRSQAHTPARPSRLHTLAVSHLERLSSLNFHLCSSP